MASITKPILTYRRLTERSKSSIKVEEILPIIGIDYIIIRAALPKTQSSGAFRR
jgi:hypothetical protein